MLSYVPGHNWLASILRRRIIAFVQIVVMLAVMVPACLDSVAAAQEETGTSIAVGADGSDNCPCCPQHEESSDCSACSYCSSSGPYPGSVALPIYAPSETTLVLHEKFMRLPDVYLPIFIPPRLLS